MLLKLFDLDGTLIDSAQNLAQFTNVIRERHGFPPLPLESLMRISGQGSLALLADAAAYQAEFLAEYQENSPLFTGVLEFLRELPLWGIVTNKRRHLAEMLLNFHQLKPAVLVCGDDLDERKPSPKPLWRACELMNYLPVDAVYVGDDVVDYQAALAAGIRFVAVSYGSISDKFRYIKEL